MVFLFLALFFLQSPDLTQKSQQAKALMGEGRFAEAIPLYQELVKAVPGNPGLILNLGMAQHMAGQDRAAIPQFESVLKVQPQALPALAMLGASYLRLREPAKAVPPLQKALTLAPADVELRQMLADALLMTNQYEQAAEQLGKLTSLQPQQPKFWYGLGRAYEALAQQSFQQLEKGAPESGYTLALIADTRLQQKRYGAALALYREASTKLPKLRGLHASLAAIYRQTNHGDWAAAEEQNEVKLPVVNCSQQPAACYFAAQRYREALQAAHLKATPEALYWRTRAYNALATQAFAKLESLPPSPELYSLLSEVARSQGRHQDSLKAIDAALRLNPQDPALRRERAIALYLSRDYTQAAPLLRAELAREPQAPDLLFALGDTLLNQQQPADAIPFLERATAQDPQLLPAHAALSRAYVQTDNATKAVPHLEKALLLDEDGSLHYQLARAYQAAGRTAEAQKLLQQYQELSRTQEAAEPAITPP